MTTVSITESEDIYELPTQTVSIRTNWSDSWTVVPNLFARYVLRAVQPTMPIIELIFGYGKGFTNDDNDFTIVEKLADLNRKFVRVQSGGDSWYGTIEVVTDKHGALLDYNRLGPLSGIPTGRQTILAYGLEFLFAKKFITSSLWYDFANVTVRWTGRGLTFNENLSGNMSDLSWSSYIAPVPNPATFAGKSRIFRTPSTPLDYPPALPWSTREIVRTLLMQYIPLNASGEYAMPVEVSEAELDKLPNYDAPVVETHKRTLLDLLNALINRYRLTCWWLDVDESESIQFKVATFTKDAIANPSGVGSVPANANVIDLQFYASKSTRAMVTVDTASQYDLIVCQGARRRNCVTVSHDNDLIEKGWTDALATERDSGVTTWQGYIDASGETADRQKIVRQYRNQDAYRDVYSRFVLSPYEAFPPNDPDGYATYHRDMRVQSTIPLIAGRNYVDYKIEEGATGDGITGKEEEMPPLVIGEIPNDGTFVRLDKLGVFSDIETTTNGDDRKFSLSVRPSKTDPSFHVSVLGAEQHAIAYGTHTPLGSYVDDEESEYDWRTFGFTIAVSDDRHCEGVWPEAVSTTNDDVRTLVIDVGDQYRLDWVAPNTVVGVDADGTRLTSYGGFVNDDREKCQDVARIAYQWYSEPRRAVVVDTGYNAGADDIGLGYYIEHIDIGADLESVNAIVSSIRYTFDIRTGKVPDKNLDGPRVTIETAFGELDVVKL